jgi:hypothetical protein
MLVENGDIVRAFVRNPRSTEWTSMRCEKFGWSGAAGGRDVAMRSAHEVASSFGLVEIEASRIETVGLYEHL